MSETKELKVKVKPKFTLGEKIYFVDTSFHDLSVTVEEDVIVGMHICYAYGTHKEYVTYELKYNGSEVEEGFIFGSEKEAEGASATILFDLLTFKLSEAEKEVEQRRRELATAEDEVIYAEANLKRAEDTLRTLEKKLKERIK